jgi:acetyltransferase
MAIHPYPHELTQHYSTPSGINVTVRPIRPEDAKMETDFVSRLSEQTKYFRYHRALQELTPEMLVRFTQIDYDREMAFVAVSDDPTLPNELGVGRYRVNPDGHSVEFSLVVADDCQHLGIGSKLMRTLMQSAKEKGMLFFEAEVLSSNEPALAMLHKLGFSIETIAGNDELVRAIKDLRQ